MITYSFTVSPLAVDRLQKDINDSKDITVKLDYISALGDAVDIVFLADLSTGEQTALQTIVSNHTGEPLPPEVVTMPVNIQNTPVVTATLLNIDTTSTERALKTCPIPMEGSSSLLISQNFCDKTSWYDGSSRVTAEILTPDLSYLVYSSSHTYWIDMCHGKVPYEDKYISTYGVKVYVDGSLVTTGYTVDYENGTITFDSSKEGYVITATYSYAVDNIWKVTPANGKVLKLLRTFVKISDDLMFPQDVGISFQVYANVGGNPNFLVAQTLYKTMTDFLTCSSRTERIVKWGNIPNDVITFYFDYTTSKEIKYEAGMYVKIGIYKIVNGQITFTEALSGTFAFTVADVLSLPP